MTYIFVPKNPQKFECKYCDYYTCNKKDYTKHMSTQKHLILTNDLQEIPKNPNTINFQNNVCECGNVYKHRQSLYKHKKYCGFLNKCDVINKSNNNNNNITIKSNDNNLQHINFDTNVVLDLVQKNQEFQKEMFLDMQKQMFDFMKDKIGDNNSTNIMNHSNNKTFNLQFFLNETCKDAMNISDFVESVKLQVSDLENVGKVGYIEGISNIIIKNLKALDVNKRPVHCADQKREVMYVKDENTWEKEDENNKKLRKAIRMIAHKNICMLKDFREKYPDCEEYDSKKNSQYNKIVYESMGGKGDDDYEKDGKIIKKIAKNVVIDKSNT
uniref:C2H2-type domain-containing protein n=1 Tax=viral metagenome TaxID=1070528 RepID=A0A6C0JHS7_9ZZZZ